MIKKTFTKLVCIILCILTVFCSSGCVIFISCALAEKEKKYVEGLKEQQKIADSFIPENTDYILETRPLDYFESEEDMRNQGFSKYSDCLPPWSEDPEDPEYSGKLVYDTNLLNIDNSNELLVEFSMRKYGYDENLFQTSFTCKKEDLVGYGFFVFGQGENAFTITITINYDNKLFVINNSRRLDGDPWTNPQAIPNALYLLDFENCKLVYCGYSITHYENLFIRKSSIDDKRKLCLKITKKEGVVS